MFRNVFKHSHKEWAEPNTGKTVRIHDGEGNHLPIAMCVFGIAGGITPAAFKPHNIFQDSTKSIIEATSNSLKKDLVSI